MRLQASHWRRLSLRRRSTHTWSRSFTWQVCHMPSLCPETPVPPRPDLVEHRRVLLVGLHLHELAPVLRALDLEILHHRLVLAAALLRGFERGADILETAAVARQAGFELLAATGNLAKLRLGGPELRPRTGGAGW